MASSEHLCELKARPCQLVDDLGVDRLVGELS
jgi:hypothetical protein